MILLTLFFLYIISLHISVAAMELLAWLVLIPVFIISISQKKYLLPNKTTLFALAGFCGVATFSFYLNGGETLQLFSYLARMRWMLLYLGFLQFFHLYYERIRFDHLFAICQAIAIIIAFYAFFQMIYATDLVRNHPVVFHSLYENSQYFRPNGFFNLPTTFGYSITMFFCLLLARTSQPFHQWNAYTKWINRVYLLLQPLVIMATFTRAVWFCFVSVTLSIIALSKKRLLIPLSCVILISLCSLYIFSSNFSNRVNSITDMTYEGNYHRIHLWNAYLHMFKDYPIFGTSLGKNRDLLEFYLQKIQRPDVLRSHSHNTYINILSSTGLTGFFFFMLFLADHFYLAIKGFIKFKNKLPQESSLFLGILGLQTVLLIGGLTECTFKDTELNHQFIVFIALAKYLSLKYVRNNPQLN